MKSPLISCIVPVYNGERFLREALQSILGQTYRPLEIIVADDGSTDDTPEVVADFAGAVTYLKQENSGPAPARNLGLAAARGEFIAFLDADDLWHEEKLESQMARFRKRPELDFCLSHAQNLWMPEVAEEEKRFRGRRRSEPVPGYVTGTLLAQRTVFSTVGNFNSSLRHGDFAEWFTRASMCGAVMELLPVVLLYRRLHKDNRSRNYEFASRDEFLRLIKSNLDHRRSKSE